MLGSLLMGDLCSLTSLVSEGKSGSMFYFSHDGLYLVEEDVRRVFHDDVSIGVGVPRVHRVQVRIGPRRRGVLRHFFALRGGLRAVLAFIEDKARICRHGSRGALDVPD